MKQNYYELLQVGKNSSLSTIKKSYQRLKQAHAGDSKYLKKLEKAYQTLSNPTKREMYNDMLADTEEEVVDKKKTEKDDFSDETARRDLDPVIIYEENLKPKKPYEKKKKETEDVGKKKGNQIIMVLAVLVIIFGLFLANEWIGKRMNSGVEARELTEITYNEFSTQSAGSEKEVVMVGRPTCSWCMQFKPILEEVQTEYNIDIYYLNTDEMSSDEVTQYLTFDETSGQAGGIATPILLVTQNGAIVNRIDGYVDKASVVEFLQSEGIIA